MWEQGGKEGGMHVGFGVNVCVAGGGVSVNVCVCEGSVGVDAATTPDL